MKRIDNKIVRGENIPKEWNIFDLVQFIKEGIRDYFQTTEKLV